MNLLVFIVAPIFTGVIGYVVGACKAFREAKQKAYQEMLPPIIKVAYQSKEANEGEFCEALVKLWLYGNRAVAKKVDNVVYIAHDHTRGNITEALQKAIVEMRKDIQKNPFQKLKYDEVEHIFTRIHKQYENNPKHNEQV